MSQNSKILSYMREHGSITTLDAFRFIGCTRLSAWIFELKEKGHNITRDIIRVKTRDGEADVARYSLEE